MLGDLLRLHHDPGEAGVAERVAVEQVPDAAWFARAGAAPPSVVSGSCLIA
jgi:hypothetical protein